MSTAPRPLIVAPLASAPEGHLHIVPQPAATVVPLDVRASDRAACGTRGALVPTRQTISTESLSHPDNDDSDPTTSPICPKCLDVHRLADAPPPPVETSGQPETMDDKRLALLQAVRFAYDLQKLRIQQGNRAGPQAPQAPAKLDAVQARFLGYAGGKLELLEQDAFKEVKRLLTQHPISEWLLSQKGCGPTMTGVIISHVDIHKVEMASQLNAWCGLAVGMCKGKGLIKGPSGEDGAGTPVKCPGCDGAMQVMESDRRRKGEKTRYNPWLKSKIIAVLGGSFIKANSPWRKHYDDYKLRKKNQLVAKCMLCNGSGKYVSKPKPGAPPPAIGELDAEGIVVKAGGICSNCDGRGGQCSWGKSDAHRHAAAVRYMCKMFLQELYVQWRTIEKLSVRKPYAEEYLGRTHHTS